MRIIRTVSIILVLVVLATVGTVWLLKNKILPALRYSKAEKAEA